MKEKKKNLFTKFLLFLINLFILFFKIVKILNLKKCNAKRFLNFKIAKNAFLNQCQ
jgi:hypothetical protein